MAVLGNHYKYPLLLKSIVLQKSIISSKTQRDYVTHLKVWKEGGGNNPDFS
jgi:hypothetical protein